MNTFTRILITTSVAAAATISIGAQSLLNVSYDPTRELYVEINAAFDKTR